MIVKNRGSIGGVVGEVIGTKEYPGALVSPEVKIWRPPFRESQSPMRPPPTPPRMPPMGSMPAKAGA